MTTPTPTTATTESTADTTPDTAADGAGPIVAVADAAPHTPTTAAPFGQEVAQHLRSVQGNLEGFAAQIADGEFGPNGAGEAGRVWRALANITDPNELVEAWGEIMATSTGLWNIDRLAEAIELVDAAARSFPLPDVWKARVEASLKEAKDYQAAREAENAFKDGRDDEALQHADRISNQSEAEHYRRILKQRLDRRRKQRKAIFTIAGVAIVSLLVASGIAISTVGRISVAPPAPNFAGFGDALEKVSNDLRQQRDMRDSATEGAPPSTQPDAQNTPTETPLPTDSPMVTEEDAPGTDTPAEPTNEGMPNLDELLQGTPQTDTSTEPNPTQPSATTDGTTTPPDAANDGSFDPVTPPATATTAADAAQEQPNTAHSLDAATDPEQASNTATNSATPNTDAANPANLRDTCLLGYAGLSEAQQLVANARNALSAEDIAVIQQRLNDFTATLEKACMKANLSAAELLAGVAAQDPTQVRGVAESILLGQQ